ncbi:LppU/SCO3897 family protein [Actinosynnema sp. ALI-1.44]|uniref:LppU/SCO3897 family protein n=1 Tax=Actinosynnema sp. ALI-1.44 TaxID=1933779 RepID=UPI000A058E66|nr:hypothetical protein [Actinosynnema sp. ALI-1.44]
MTYPPQGHYPSPQGYPHQPQQPYPPQQYPPPQYPAPQYQAPQQQFPPPSDPGGFPQQQYQPPGGGFPPQNTPPGPPPNLPPPLPKKSGGRKVVGGVIALGVVGLIIFGIVNWGTGAASAEAGDCIKVVKASSADAEKADCTTQEAVYKVAKKLDSSSDLCPKGDYTEWTRRSRRDTMKLCLMLNAKEGDCFKISSGAGNQADERSPCGGSAVKVAKVVSGKADASACGKGKGNMAAVYSEPATTLCLARS